MHLIHVCVVCAFFINMSCLYAIIEYWKSEIARKV